MPYDNGSSGPSLGHAQQCDWFKPVNSKCFLRNDYHLK